jgi:hypothetical protein
MNRREPESLPEQGSIETEIVAACAETITTVMEAVRTVRTAALDVHDAVVSLQRLHSRLKAEASQAAPAQVLQQALDHGVALVHTFDTIGMYDPVPIEQL